MTTKLEQQQLNELGFGISLLNDMSPNIRPSWGIERLKEAVVARLSDDLWYDDEYGYNLVRNLFQTDSRQIPRIQQSVQRELLKDDRIRTCQCQIRYEGDTAFVRIDIVSINNETIVLTQRLENKPGVTLTF